MQLVARARGSALEAMPRSRRASIRPPPMSAPRPSPSPSRRVIDSQFVCAPIALVLEYELGRVDQGPEQVGDRLPRGNPRLGEDARADRTLFVRRQPAEGEQVKLLDDRL